MGPFAGGVCGFACTGACTSGPGTGRVTGCKGLCVSPTGDAGAPCAGRCTGTCSQPFTTSVCAGTLNCGPTQNLECTNACEAQAAMSFTCAPPADMELETVSDPQLYAAIKKHAGELVVASQMLIALRNAEGFIQNRALSDFVAVGAGNRQL